MTRTTSQAAGENIERLIDEVSRSHEPIQIVGGVHSAMLVAEEDWRAIQETCYLLSQPGMRESIREGMQAPVSQCAEEPGW